ncbi:perforin-1-like [Hypanus sabinus]|uniref:perforin-1-like n=1 Tax=Hypanus sabinus TaxID=79690 RepID=UPI0028C44042|nr:perforin-1-like [Hypanus sabinus]
MDAGKGWKMGTLLWAVLFLGGVGAVCQIGNARECRRASPVPGSSLAGEGFDVVTLDRKGAYVVDVESWRRPGGACKLCRNTLMRGRWQRLPLAVVDWRAQRRCYRTVKSRLFHSASAFSSSVSSSVDKSWSVGLGISKYSVSVGVTVAGSKSRAMSFANRKAQSDNYSFSSQKFLCRLYRYRLRNTPPLASEFSNQLKQITSSSYAGARHQYRQIVQTFGTHYFRSVEVGGSYKDVTAIRTCEAVSQGLTATQVKNCLSVEASVSVLGFGHTSARAGYCKKQASSHTHSHSFHQAFSERLTEVSGGHSTGHTDILFSSSPRAFTSWMNSLTASPGIIHYRLAPLHFLLPRTNIRRKHLRRYLREYIMANAMKRDCSRTTCPAPGRKSRFNRCSCRCPENSLVDRQCCAKQKGAGHLVVTVINGSGLWGDYLSGTDGFVVVSYGNAKAQTRVVDNNNNPTWNARLDLGEVVAHSYMKLILKVYDKDPLRKDNLGTCKVPLISGVTDLTCYLKHGKVTYQLSFICGLHLQGRTCHQYAPSPGAREISGLLWTNQSFHSSDSPTALPSGNALLKVIYP